MWLSRRLQGLKELSDLWNFNGLTKLNISGLSNFNIFSLSGLDILGLLTSISIVIYDLSHFIDLSKATSGLHGVHVILIYGLLLRNAF